MAWNLQGTYFETCSCDLMCPCNFSFDHGATYDYCRVTLVFNVATGDVEGTDVGGRTVVVIADTPKVMTDGNWRLGMFVDEGASDEQMEKLTAVFGGQKGGPMAGLAPLTSTQRLEWGLRRRISPAPASSLENSCATVPLQVHRWMAVPSVVPAPATSTHLPLATCTRRESPPPSASTRKACAPLPLQLHDWMRVPSALPLPSTSRQVVEPPRLPSS